MEFHIDRYDAYDIRGVFIQKGENANLVISVNDPLNREIDFECYSGIYNRLHPPRSRYGSNSQYTWLGIEKDLHRTPAGDADYYNNSVYYNVEDNCFYKKGAGDTSEWERTDFEEVYDDNPNLLGKDTDQGSYVLFRDRYRAILHKGMLCNFYAYALEKKDDGTYRSISTNNVKRHPEDYTWIYDPDSFHIEKWNTESIDSLVKEIRPSRDCLKQLRKTYRADDRKAIVKKLKRIGKAIKSAPRRFWTLLSKDGKLVIRLATLIIALGTLIAGTTVAVITILNYFNKG